MISQIVKHSKFGEGEIVEFKNEKITVVFKDSQEKKVFKYPDAFESFLEAKDNNFKEKIFEDICNDKVAIGNEIKRVNEEEHKKK